MKATPIRIQRSRKHKQVSPNGLPIKYVGRPGKFGNPFKVTGESGHWFVVDDYDERLERFSGKQDAIDCCIEIYKEYITHEHNAGVVNLFDLKGKNLSCWCKIGEPCHADVLLEIANRKNDNPENSI